MLSSCQFCSVISLPFLYPEVSLTSFLSSMSYWAHGGAILTVFFGGLSVTQGKGRHKAVVHRNARAEHKSSITVFVVQVCEKNDCGGCTDRCHSCPALHCKTGPVAPRGNSPPAEGHQSLRCHSSWFL